MNIKKHLKIYLGFQIKIGQNRFPRTGTLDIDIMSRDIRETFMDICETFARHFWTFKT